MEVIVLKVVVSGIMSRNRNMMNEISEVIVIVLVVIWNLLMLRIMSSDNCSVMLEIGIMSEEILVMCMLML